MFYRIILFCFLAIVSFFFLGFHRESEERTNIKLLKKMFSEMVEKKNASLIPNYYHQDLILYTNGQIINYASFLESHETYYKTPIQYNIKFDEESFVAQENRVACRVWIIISNPNEPSKEIEVILISEYKEGKIYRLWELTYPDWSKLSAFTT